MTDTLKKDPESRLRALDRTLRALRNSSKALVRATDEPSLLREVCRIIVEDCGHAMAWVGLAENDADKSIRPAAYSGFEEGYLESLKLTWADTGRGRGPTGRAIRTGAVCMCRNMPTDPDFAPWREEARQRGYASSIALPLSCGDAVIGALTLYSREPDPFSDDELSLLAELADDLAFGLSALRLRQASVAAEEALRVSEDLFRRTLQALPAHIAVVDRAGRILSVNAAWSRFARDTAASGGAAVAVGSNYLEVCRDSATSDDAGAAQALAGIEAVLTGAREEFSMEYPCHGPQEKRWFLMTVTPLGGHGENGAVISHLNITDRKQAEEQLVATTQRLQALMTAVPIGISFSDDPSCQRVSGNPAVLEQFEVTPADNLSASAPSANEPGRKVQFFIDGRHLADVELPLQRAVAENSVIPPMEIEVLLPSGRRWFAEASGAPVRDAQGRVLGGIAVTVDITERKRAEEALRASEERLRLVLQATAMGTFEVDLVTGEGRWNTVEFELLGLTPGEIPGNPETFFRFVHPEDVAELRRQWEGALQSGLLEAEFRVIRADGVLRWLAAKGQFVFEEQAERTDPKPRSRAVRFMGVNFDITARKQAEEQMRFQARLLEAVGQAVVSTDLEQRITYWNKTAATLFGWTAAEALGRSLLELTRPDTTPAMDDELRAMLARGQAWSRELQLHRKDGTVLPLFTTNAPVLNDKGELSAIIGVGVDLTERKLTEDVLRFLGQCGIGGTGEGFFHDLARYLAQSLSMDFVCIDRLEDDQLTARTLAVFHNGSFEDNVSYSLKDTPCGDVVGKRICCFPANVRELFAKDAVLQELKAESYLGATLWNSQGKPIGLIAVIGRQPLKDTRQAESVLQMVAVRASGELERLQSESALRESEERYRLLFQNVQEGFYLAEPVFDERGNCCDAVYLEVNPAFERIMGLPHDQIIGRRIKELVPAISPEWLEAFGKVARTGEPVSHQAYSETFRKHFEAFIFRPVPGNFAVLVSDITTRKQFEQAITRLNAQLEDRVAKRTEELAFTNRELEAFCYSVSHDLRAPLRSMDGFSQALLEDYGTAIDATGQDYLNRIRSNCQRMARLIDDLLHLSRLTRAQMRRQPVDLTALAQAVIAELRQAEPERAVDVRIAPDLVATGDPVLLRTAIGNLLQNAWKFTGQRTDSVIEMGVMAGDRKSEVGGQRSEVSPDPASSPVFFVRDNGVGFDMQYADKLCMPFQRLHAMTEFPGSGIGLATVQRVLHRHGGRIWFDSAPGQGAAFFFTIGDPACA